MQVNIYEAKTRFAELIKLLEEEAETEVVIARRGKPVARLVKYEQLQARPWGLLKGQFEVSDDFDDFDEDIAEMFGL